MTKYTARKNTKLTPHTHLLIIPQPDGLLERLGRPDRRRQVHPVAHAGREVPLGEEDTGQGRLRPVVCSSTLDLTCFNFKTVLLLIQVPQRAQRWPPGELRSDAGGRGRLERRELQQQGENFAAILFRSFGQCFCSK